MPNKSFEEKIILVLAILVILNGLDLFLTMFLFEAKYISEGNPIMGAMLDNSTLTFALIKLLLCYSGVILIYIYREASISMAAAYVAVSAYSIIILKHLWIIGTLALS